MSDVTKSTVEGNCMTDMMKEVNKWLGSGKFIKKIDVEVNKRKYYSHKAIIETVVITRGKNGTIKNDIHERRRKRKTVGKDGII